MNYEFSGYNRLYADCHFELSNESKIYRKWLKKLEKSEGLIAA